MVIEGIKKTSLYLAGYKEHETVRGKGFIRELGRSRYHVMETNKGFDIHFDYTRQHKYIGNRDGILVGEIRRIKRIDKNLNPQLHLEL